MADNNRDPLAQQKALDRALAERRAGPPPAAAAPALDSARESFAAADGKVASSNDGEIIGRVLDGTGIPRQYANTARAHVVEYVNGVAGAAEAYNNRQADPATWQEHEKRAAAFADLELRKAGISRRDPTAEQRKRNLEGAGMSDRAWTNYLASKGVTRGIG